MTERIEVTLRPEFVAKDNPDAFAIDPMFTFRTAEGRAVSAFSRRPLLLAGWREPGCADGRGAFLHNGEYSFGREVGALVEVTAKGYLKLVRLDRADAKAKVQS